VVLRPILDVPRDVLDGPTRACYKGHASARSLGTGEMNGRAAGAPRGARLSARATTAGLVAVGVTRPRARDGAVAAAGPSARAFGPRVAVEWMARLVDRVRAERLSPPVASRVYAYAGARNGRDDDFSGGTVHAKRLQGKSMSRYPDRQLWNGARLR
jgi:hypothetical protein